MSISIRIYSVASSWSLHNWHTPAILTGNMQTPPSTIGSSSWQARRADVARMPMACPYQTLIGHHTTGTTASKSAANGLMYPTMPS